MGLFSLDFKRKNKKGHRAESSARLGSSLYSSACGAGRALASSAKVRGDSNYVSSRRSVFGPVRPPRARRCNFQLLTVTARLDSTRWGQLNSWRGSVKNDDTRRRCCRRSTIGGCACPRPHARMLACNIRGADQQPLMVADNLPASQSGSELRGPICRLPVTKCPPYEWSAASQSEISLGPERSRESVRHPSCGARQKRAAAIMGQLDRRHNCGARGKRLTG